MVETEIRKRGIQYRRRVINTSTVYQFSAMIMAHGPQIKNDLRRLRIYALQSGETSLRVIRAGVLRFIEYRNPLPDEAMVHLRCY